MLNDIENCISWKLKCLNTDVPVQWLIALVISDLHTETKGSGRSSPVTSYKQR